MDTTFPILTPQRDCPTYDNLQLSFHKLQKLLKRAQLGYAVDFRDGVNLAESIEHLMDCVLDEYLRVVVKKSEQWITTQIKKRLEEAKAQLKGKEIGIQTDQKQEEIVMITQNDQMQAQIRLETESRNIITCLDRDEGSSEMFYWTQQPLRTIEVKRDHRKKPSELEEVLRFAQTPIPGSKDLSFKDQFTCGSAQSRNQHRPKSNMTQSIKGSQLPLQPTFTMDFDDYACKKYGMSMQTQVLLKRQLGKEELRFKRINRYMGSQYDSLVEKKKRLAFLQNLKGKPLFVMGYNQYGDMTRCLYLGDHSQYKWDEDQTLQGGPQSKHTVLKSGLMMLIDSKSTEIQFMEREIEVRVNEYYWLLVRKCGFSLDYQWVIKLWQFLDIYTFEPYPSD
ncbi:hypothetical protein FGO68_gene17227 [Halteria grandinella]|uniref:Uncharacterized protein n=1 Tax=Halteria grandinella TaxID=5974 RepID=A0A8J8T0N9_HALGN|nr:hypothetical protein FGO68_gene17227 [Halteria grandinella]